MSFDNKPQDFFILLEKLIGQYIEDVNVQSVYRFPDLEVDKQAFLAQHGRAVLFMLGDDELDEEQPQGCETRIFTLEAMLLLKDITETQHLITGFVEAIKYVLRQHKQESGAWYNARVERVIYPSADDATNIKTALLTLRILADG